LEKQQTFETLTTQGQFDGILARIRELPGVSNSETCPLLRQIG
jgi:hypothetical protein